MYVIKQLLALVSSYVKCTGIMTGDHGHTVVSTQLTHSLTSGLTPKPFKLPLRNEHCEGNRKCQKTFKLAYSKNKQANKKLKHNNNNKTNPSPPNLWIVTQILNKYKERPFTLGRDRTHIRKI